MDYMELVYLHQIGIAKIFNLLNLIPSILQVSDQYLKWKNLGYGLSCNFRTF